MATATKAVGTGTQSVRISPKFSTTHAHLPRVKENLRSALQQTLRELERGRNSAGFKLQPGVLSRMTLDAKGEESRKAGAIRIVNEDKRELHVVSLADFGQRQTNRRNAGTREEEILAPTPYWNTSSKEGTRSTLETA